MVCGVESSGGWPSGTDKLSSCAKCGLAVEYRGGWTHASCGCTAGMGFSGRRIRRCCGTSRPAGRLALVAVWLALGCPHPWRPPTAVAAQGEGENVTSVAPSDAPSSAPIATGTSAPMTAPVEPNGTDAPTAPPQTANPTASPSVSAAPITAKPTISPRPTFAPSLAPIPTASPTPYPTTSEVVSLQQEYLQELIVLANASDPQSGFLNGEEVDIFQKQMEAYTPFYGDELEANMINTTCNVKDQKLVEDQPTPEPSSTRTLILRLGRALGIVGHPPSPPPERRKRPLPPAFWGRLTLQDNTTSPRHAGRVLQAPAKLSDKTLQLTYRMTWTSRYSTLEGYPLGFRDYINNNKETVYDNLRRGGIAQLEGVQNVTLVVLRPPTPPPTSAPTGDASLIPTTTKPTATPTAVPTAVPTAAPTAEPTESPFSPAPSTHAPTSAPLAPPSVLSTGAIAAISIGGALVLVGIGIFCLVHRQKVRGPPPPPSSQTGTTSVTKSGEFRDGSALAQAPPKVAYGDEEVGDTVVAVAVANEGGGTLPTVASTASPARPDGAIAEAGVAEAGVAEAGVAAAGAAPPVVAAAPDSGGSHDRMPSSGSHGRKSSSSSGASARKHHGRKASASSAASAALQQQQQVEDLLMPDDFDSFKDPNIEAMRTEVQETVTGTDEMMSQAVTKALINSDVGVWGEGMESVEIEATILYETYTWMRKTAASIEDRRTFMQDMLNKMVLCVRNGFVPPEKASRTIHECASLLGLEIAEAIPETSLMVTNMRKAAETEDLHEAFKVFGAIQEAAVAPKESGFGLVRYVSPKGVSRAMDQFNRGEIIVQDVAVRVLLIGAS